MQQGFYFFRFLNKKEPVFPIISVRRDYWSTHFASLNLNKRGIGGKTFLQNDFTPWCLKLNIFFYNLVWVANCMTILFEFNKNFKITSFSNGEKNGENGEKPEKRAVLYINTLLEGLCPFPLPQARAASPIRTTSGNLLSNMYSTPSGNLSFLRSGK